MGACVWWTEGFSRAAPGPGPASTWEWPTCFGHGVRTPQTDRHSCHRTLPATRVKRYNPSLTQACSDQYFDSIQNDPRFGLTHAEAAAYHAMQGGGANASTNDHARGSSQVDPGARPKSGAGAGAGAGAWAGAGAGAGADGAIRAAAASAPSVLSELLRHGFLPGDTTAPHWLRDALPWNASKGFNRNLAAWQAVMRARISAYGQTNGRKNPSGGGGFLISLACLRVPRAQMGVHRTCGRANEIEVTAMRGLLNGSRCLYL